MCIWNENKKSKDWHFLFLKIHDVKNIFAQVKKNPSIGLAMSVHQDLITKGFKFTPQLKDNSRHGPCCFPGSLAILCVSMREALWWQMAGTYCCMCYLSEWRATCTVSYRQPQRDGSCPSLTSHSLPRAKDIQFPPTQTSVSLFGVRYMKLKFILIQI